MGHEEALAESQSRIAPLLEPVGGGVGEDVSYDPLFEAVKAEIDRLAALEGGKVDWTMIVSHTEELLGERSKDFRAACYFAAAKPRTDGFPGLLDGLVLLNDLSAAFWDSMHPPVQRARARANILSWFAEATAPIYADSRPNVSDRAVVLAIDKASLAMDAQMRDRLGEAYQGIAPLRDAIRELCRKLPEEPKVAPPPPPAAPAGPAPAAQPAPAVVAPPAPVVVAWPKSFADADAAREAANEISFCLSHVANALRDADAADADAYRFGRLGAWMLNPTLPPNEGGRTAYRAPPPVLRNELAALLAAEDWMTLLHAADRAVNDHVFWLDPNRFVATAMDRLGGKFIPARKALITEIAAYLGRIPGMIDLTFSDGTPFADGPTKLWLESEAKPLSSPTEGGGEGASSVLQAPLGEARTLVAAGKIEDALRVLHGAAARAPSRAERFQVELAAAKLALQAEQRDIARALLSGLEQHVIAHRLHEWDPPLATSYYEALFLAAREENDALKDASPEALAREQRAFEWLCLLDPATAIRARG